jgi:hypothetical protein
MLPNSPCRFCRLAPARTFGYNKSPRFSVLKPAAASGDGATAHVVIHGLIACFPSCLQVTRAARLGRHQVGGRR